MRHYLNAGAAAIAIVACSTAAYAQETTSSIRGTVASAGAPVAGASVTITHVPSGTTTTATTGADGGFTSSGLRPGGPFTVVVTAPGFADSTVTDINLTAGQPLRIPVELATQDAIVVTAANIRATELSPGPITSIGREQIATIASVSRDIRDIARRDPFATIDPGQSRGVMIAGQNARLNKFSVDGLGFSDDFGLNVGGLPTSRGPVPLDAIEQFSVKVAPYDVSEGNFQGGAINVILRSGTNKLTGTAFYTYNSDKLTGDKIRTGKINLDFKSKTYGGFLSGPLIKDKLFLAVSYEHLKEGTPIQIGTAGFPNVVPNLTDAQITNISTIARSAYNYDTLGVQQSTVETDEKWTVKADWNITDGHRLSATWIHNDSNNSSTAGFSSIVGTSPVLGLQSNNYNRPEKVDSYVSQLISDWSDSFHTEVRGNYRKYDLTPLPFGEFNFAQMQVCLDPTAATQQNGAANTNATLCSQGSTAAPGAARLYFGPDQFRHFNYVRYKQYGGDAAVRWEYKDFSFKLTGAYSHLDVQNAFLQNAFGNYYFDSVADFQNRRAGSLALGGSITGNLNDALASFQYDSYTIGQQVAWDPSPDLNITAGVRTDMYGGLTPPPLNTFFTARYGFSNRATINGKYVIQPRLSYTWSPLDKLTLKGGVGLFAGGSPNVFLGNSYSVSGVVQNSFTITRNLNGVGCQGGISDALCSAALDNVDGRNLNPLVQSFLRTNTASLSLANVNALDPDFKLQSTWKANFSASYDHDFDNFLGTGWTVGFDLYGSKVNYAPLYTDLRLRRVGVTPDGRPRYASITPTSANTDLYLTNTRLGHSVIGAVSWNKHFDYGIDIGGTYTRQSVKDVSSMNGTTASGTYGQNPVIDPNRSAYGRSIYEIKNSWKLHLDFEHEYIDGYKTRLNIFAERRSGIPYSLTMNDSVQTNSHGNVFGTAGSSNRYLLYVPNVSSITADSLVTYDSAATFNNFAAFVTANGLKQGKIAKKNSQTAPHWDKIDLHIDQEIPLPVVSTGKITVFADLENVLNMLNKNWGSLRQVAFPYLASVVNVACVSVVNGNCTQYRYSNFSNPAVANQGRVSLWALRLGARVGF
ncbi:TonB-dependent receptor [Sphingomonas crocodyli]|uniref:TonB-dependent transporter Oar-like beta-barrel domain-containing protein n=1 Tax=Sphingomonas crocodyli TaxID=1979270 RepID=A0A437LUV5_9SPHN|nr:carboxypeptidase regulatory-like domain-containing protein [Sphingomonas crocodyli]RVT89169.1 hypothetical protein EOD43_22910 [Sphingomonas crocodyli]